MYLYTVETWQFSSRAAARGVMASSANIFRHPWSRSGRPPPQTGSRPPLSSGGTDLCHPGQTSVPRPALRPRAALHWQPYPPADEMAILLWPFAYCSTLANKTTLDMLGALI